MSAPFHIIEKSDLPKLNDPKLAAKMFALGQAEGMSMAARMLIAYAALPQVLAMPVPEALSAAATALASAAQKIKATETKGHS